LSYRWSHKVVRNRYVAHYYECGSCRALQVVDPSWLAEAYAQEGNPLVDNPDKGRFARNFSAFHYIAALVESGVVPERPMTLDFGGGYGILTQMLRSGGYEAWQADPHVPVPFLAADRGLSRLEDFPDGSFDLVTSLEVMEHLDDPQSVVDRLARLLKPGGTLMLSTTLYRPGEHDQNWFYLHPETGQHITFWSREALIECARRAGFKSVGFYPGDDGFFILFSNVTAGDLSGRLANALECVRDGRMLARITAPWDLRSMGYVRVLDEPIVIALEDGHHQLAALSGRGAA
jgi:SAM-dependent methyltransferase